MVKVNISQICTITSHVNKQCKQYEYKKTIRFLFITLQSAGFYDTFDSMFGTPVSYDEILQDSHLFITGKGVFYRPHILFNMTDHKSYILWFNSEDEMDKYLREVDLENSKWITF